MYFCNSAITYLRCCLCTVIILCSTHIAYPSSCLASPFRPWPLVPYCYCRMPHSVQALRRMSSASSSSSSTSPSSKALRPSLPPSPRQPRAPNRPPTPPRWPWMISHPHTPSSLLTTITTREASSSEIPRAVPPLPTHLNYFAGVWGELPLGIRDSLFQVSLDDVTGCVVQAKTSAYQVARTNAEEVHRRITTVLRRQQDEIAAAIPEAERGLADLQRAVHECELRLASLRQRAQDTDEAISSADTLPDTFLRDLRFAAPQPPTTAPLASPVASTSVDLQPLATVSLAAHATPTSAGSQSPTLNG